MECAECREALQAYLDDELSERETLAVEEHIRVCVGCAEEFQRMYQVNHLVQKAFEGVSTGGNKVTAAVLMHITKTTEEQRETALREARRLRRQEEEEAKRLIGKTVAGYKIIELLGTGGMGSVYKAIQLSMEREVAIKILSKRLSMDETYIARFIREARAAGELNHPNIVRVYDVKQDDGIFFFSMELIEGESVHQRVTREGRLEPREALDIALQVAMALEHAHSKGIIHRDVKPENIMLDKDGTVKLADLGLAKRSFIPEDSAATVEGHIMGSPHYMSPEQVTDTASVDYRSDVYSLGASLYFMVTGEKPFANKGSLMEVMVAVLQEGIKFNKAQMQFVPLQVMRLIRRLCATNPQARPQTMRDAADEIERVLRGPLTHKADRVRRLAPVATTEKVRKKSAAPLVIAAAAAVLIAVILLFALRSKEPITPTMGEQPVAEREVEPEPTPKPEPRPEPKPTVTPPEPKVDAVAQMGLRELQDAKKFEQENPEAYAEILRRYKRIARDYEGKMPARAAQSEYDRLIAELDEKFAEQEKKVEALLKEGKYDEAKSHLMAFCKKFVDTPQEEKASAKIRQIDRTWEEVSRRTLEVAEKLINEGKLDEAMDVLETAEKAHPIVRSRFVTLRERVSKLVAQKKERERLAQYEQLCLNFYEEMVEVLTKGDVELIRKEVQAKRESYGEITEETDRFVKDIDTLATLYSRVMEKLKKDSSRFHITLQLANGETLTGRVQDLSHSSFMLDMGARGKQGVLMRTLSPEFVERVASSVYSPTERREREVGLAIFCLIHGGVAEARARFDITFPNFSRALAALSALQKGSFVNYDRKSDDLHYARLYRGMEQPLIRIAKKREVDRLFTGIKRDKAAKRYEEASAKLERLLSGEFDEFITDQMRAELEEIEEFILAKMEKQEKKEPKVSQKKGRLLAALNEYFHAASIKQVKKTENIFEFIYDFKNKEQLLDWRFNDEAPSKRRIDRMWRDYENSKRRRRRRINYERARNFSLLPYGIMNVIKIHDAALRWCAVTEGDLSLEFTIIPLECNNIKANICENDEGRYIFGWAVGTDEDYRRNVLKGARHAIVRVDTVEGEDEHHELIPRHRCYKGYLAVPKKLQRYVLLVKKKGDDLRLYVGGALFVSGKDDTFDEGTLAINAYGESSFLVAKVRIQCRLQERWLKENVLKGKKVAEKPKDKEKIRKDDDDIGKFVEATKKRLKGMTDDDCRRLEEALSHAKELQEGVRGWLRPFDRLKERVEDCKDVEELRRLLDDIERLKKQWPGGGNPGGGPGGWPGGGRRGPGGGRRRGP